jgi:transcriptional regulator
MDIFQENPQWKGFSENDQVFVHFFWASFLISSSLILIMKLPTWNYIAVHVYGKIKGIEAGRFLVYLQRVPVQ